MIDTPSLALLSAYLQKLEPLSQEELACVLLSFSYGTLRKSMHLCSEGEVCDTVLFIGTGYFRLYALHDADPVTIHLAGPGSFVSCFTSFLQRSPSQTFLQTVTDAHVLSIDHVSLMNVYDQSARLERLGRKIMEQYFIEKDNQVVSFIRESAEERYRNLLTTTPDFFLHIPLQYIASYLGMKPETLSRIRSRV